MVAVLKKLHVIIFIGALTFVCLLCLNKFAIANKRGQIQITLKDSRKPIILYRSSYALVIGIDRYVGGWQPLNQAVNDAKKVADVLNSQGFKVTLLTSEKDKLTAAELRRAFRRFLITGPGSEPEARLLIWFAGHGHSSPIPGAVDNHLAYLVGSDAPLPPRRPEDDYRADAHFQDKAIPLRQFDTWLHQTRARHVLTIFDSCFSGSIFTTRAAQPSPVVNRATRLSVRQFISSGQAGQEVSDDGRFRGAFLAAITGADPRADQNGDGYILGSELGQYLYQEVSEFTNGLQTPQHGKLRAMGFNRGDYVFALPGRLEPSIELKYDPEVRRIQELLALLGYDPGSTKGIIEEKTRAAIRAFQQKSGLPADGQVSITLGWRLQELVTDQFESKAKEEQLRIEAEAKKQRQEELKTKQVELVKRIQKHLRELGCYRGPIDGKFETGSRDAWLSATKKVFSKAVMSIEDFNFLKKIGKSCRTAGQSNIKTQSSNTKKNKPSQKTNSKNSSLCLEARRKYNNCLALGGWSSSVVTLNCGDELPRKCR